MGEKGGSREKGNETIVLLIVEARNMLFVASLHNFWRLMITENFIANYTRHLRIWFCLEIKIITAGVWMMEIKNLTAVAFG